MPPIQDPIASAPVPIGPEPSRDRTIPSLDGLRGISIALVMLAHLADTRNAPAWLSSPVFDHGVLGVRVFFVISGFLITRLIFDEIALTGRLSLKLFYIRRALRIFPAFYVYLAVVALASSLHWLDIPGRNLAFAATYTMNYVLDGRWETGHLWSLAVEEQFYLLWPFTLYALGGRRALMLAALLAVTAPYGLLALYVHGAGPYLLATTTFPLVADGLAAGCVLGGWLETWLRNDRFRRAIASRWGECVPALVLGLDFVDHHSVIYHGLSQLLTTAGICYCVARYTTVVDSFGARVLASPSLVWVGRRSYSLYLWQQLFLNRYHATVLQMFPLNIGFAFACAAASYRFIERPLNRFRRRYHPTVPRQREAVEARRTIETTAGLRPNLIASSQLRK
jgi:peptidoglycan/LPS O-acetylase OafA/YrhL